jgi:hypothetical protein
MRAAKKVFTFPEMIEWRKAKIVQERLQRNKVSVLLVFEFPAFNRHRN